MEHDYFCLPTVIHVLLLFKDEIILKYSWYDDISYSSIFLVELLMTSRISHDVNCYLIEKCKMRIFCCFYNEWNSDKCRNAMARLIFNFSSFDTHFSLIVSLSAVLAKIRVFKFMLIQQNIWFWRLIYLHYYENKINQLIKEYNVWNHSIDKVSIKWNKIPSSFYIDVTTSIYISNRTFWCVLWK